MKVIFSHGKESGPWGIKIQRLADIARSAGHSVESVDYTGMPDPDLRVKKLLGIVVGESSPIILVGSSMGGYVSLVAAERLNPAGVFLLAPALYLPGYQHQKYYTKCSHIEMIHGWGDEVVPVAGSIRFAQQVDCSLHLIRGDHRLNSSLGIVAAQFELFLAQFPSEGADYV